MGIGHSAYLYLYKSTIELTRKFDKVTSLGKHIEKYGRKVSGLKVPMVAGLQHRVSSLALPSYSAAENKYMNMPAQSRWVEVQFAYVWIGVKQL